MIQINKEKKTIVFAKSYNQTEHAPVRECPLLMAYECSECKRIILAYFRTEEHFEIHRYFDESEDEKEYRIFQINGACGLELIRHDACSYDSSPECSWFLCGALSLCENVKKIVEIVHKKLYEYKYNNKPPIPTVEKVSKSILDFLKSQKGIKIIPDLCSRREPMFIIKVHSFIESLHGGTSTGDDEKEMKKRKERALQSFLKKVCGRK